MSKLHVPTFCGGRVGGVNLCAADRWMAGRCWSHHAPACPDGRVTTGDRAGRVAASGGAAATRADALDSCFPGPLEAQDGPCRFLVADQGVDDPAAKGAEDTPRLLASGCDPGHGGDGAQVVEGDGEDALADDAVHLLAGEVVEPGADVADGAGGVELGPLGRAESEGVEQRSG